MIFRNTPSCSDCGTRRLASTCGNAPLNTTPSSGDHENDDDDDDDDGGLVVTVIMTTHI